MEVPQLKKNIFTITLLFLFMLVGCGKVTGVNETIGPSQLYSESEIQSAMNLVKTQFSTGFEGCVLLDLWYDEEFSSKHADDWAEQYKADEAIVLLSNFYVSGNKNPTLNPNSKYENWNWILVRSNGGWHLKDWGY